MPRFRLLPGLVPVRRDGRQLQFGIDPPTRVVVPDVPEVRDLLSALVLGIDEPPAAPTARTVLHRLRTAGLVVLDRPAPVGQVPLLGSPDLIDPTAAALRELGIEPRRGLDETAPAAPVVVVETGPVSRERADLLLRDGRPHLPVSAAPDGWSIGPFVGPGRTACLRCVDAARAERDPGRRLVLDQHLRRRARPPLDPVMIATALPWVVRDVLAFLRGDRPATWSRTLWIGPSGPPELTAWERHPRCGCAWDAIA